MNKFGLYILILLCFAKVYSKEDTVNTNILDHNFKVNFYVNAGGILSVGGTNFFDVYLEHFGGKKQIFDKTPNLGGGVRLIYNPHWRLNVSGNFFYASLNENYVQQYENKIESSSRVIDQTIEIRNIPLVASIEYIPFDLSYKTFIGAGLGLDIGSFKWVENIENRSLLDNRLGGTWASGTIIRPIFRLSTGVNLLFDREHPEYVLQNFMLEFRYNFVYRNEDLFSGVKDQFIDTPEELNSRYLIFPSYIELNIGASFNFEK